MVLLVMAVVGAVVWAVQLQQPRVAPTSPSMQQQLFGDSNAQAELAKLEVKGRAPKTGYSRKQFSDGWGKMSGCSVREVILARDLMETKIDDKRPAEFVGCRRSGQPSQRRWRRRNLAAS